VPIIKKIVLVLCSLFFTLLYADLGVAIGLNLELESGFSFDGNVFRVPERPVSDSVFTFAPVLSVQHPFHRTFLRLDSRFISDRYYHYTEANFHQISVKGGARYNLSSHLSFEVNDEWANVQNARQSTLGEITTRFSYLSNQLSPLLKYERPNGRAITVAYSNESRDFKDSRNQDWNTNGMKLSLLYPLGYKTTAQLLFGLKHKVFGSDIAYRSQSVAIELSRKLSSKFNVSAQLGWEDRTYRSNENLHSLLVDINIAGELFRKIPVRLGFRRPLTDSDIYAGQALIPMGSGFSFSWDLTSKIQLKVEGDISRDIYPSLKRSDLRFFGKVQAGYRMGALGTFYLTCEREQINSQIKGEGFHQNQVGISLVRPVPLFSQ